MNLKEIKKILKNKKILDQKVAKAEETISTIVGELEELADKFGIPFYLNYSPIGQTFYVEQSEEMAELLDSEYVYEDHMCKYKAITELTDDSDIIKQFADLAELDWESEYGCDGWQHSAVC